MAWVEDLLVALNHSLRNGAAASRTPAGTNAMSADRAWGSRRAGA
jgi:hypothetical protein